MKTRAWIFIGSIWLLLSAPAYGQQEQYRWRVGAYLGTMLYYGDLNQRLIPETVNPDHPAFGFSLERALNNAWSAKLLYNQGQWIANDRRGNSFLARSLNAKTAVRDYSLLFTYYLDNNRQLGRRSFLAPYVSFGIGYTDFSMHGDLRDSDGNYYHYWSDYTIRSTAETDPSAAQATVVGQDGTYETELSSLATEQSYPTESFNVPLALGLKFRLSSNVNLNLELLMRYAFTDYLDDVSGAYRTEYSSADQQLAANPTGREATQRGSSPNVKDFYAFPSVSLHYSFARRKTAYRAPKLYAVADRVDRFTPEPNALLRIADTTVVSTTVVDTIAAVPIDQLASGERLPFADSLRIVPHVVGQDTLLAVVQPIADSLARLSGSDTARVQTDSLGAVSMVSSARLSRMAPVDTLALINPATLAAPNVRAADTIVSSPLIPLSDNRAIRVQNDSSGARLQLVAYDSAPAATSVPYFGTFDPRPDSVVSQPATPETVTRGVTTREAPPSFSVLPAPEQAPEPSKPPTDSSAKTNPVKTPVTAVVPGDTAVSPSKTGNRSASADSVKNLLAKTEQPDDSSSMVPASAEANPVGVGVAVVPASLDVVSDTAAANQPDTSYVAALTARMDTFTGYLNDVSQKSDTSFASILSEVKQLKAQLNNLQNAAQPAAQAAAIDQQLRSLKLRELGTTEVFFGLGSSTVSTVGIERLQQVAVLIRNAPEATVRLRGFTDTMGNPERNQLLSQKRAEAVRTILTDAGVAEQRITAAYFGADRTLGASEAAYGRRVEVVVE